MTRRGLARFTTAPGRRTPTGLPAQGSVANQAGAGAGPGGGTAGAASGGGVAGPPPDVAPELAQFLSTRPAPAPGEACELCATAVTDDHRHVVDLERRSMLCACRGCALLFEHTGADASPVPAGRPTDARPHRTRYRTVPDRYLRIAPFALPEPSWAALQIPVGIAFVVTNTRLDATVAFYPSPGGATESDLPLDTWADVVEANPALRDVEPDVEAVLVRTDRDDPTCHVVPVDRCYELVGALRLHWRGFDGGSEVREHIAAFFDDVGRRAGRGAQART